MKIYIFCPAYVATGGVELAHQFQYRLNLLGIETYLYYVGLEKGRTPIHEGYVKYNIKYTEMIEDKADNIVVIPEVYLDYLLQIKNAQKIVWWMSVDFAKGSEEAYKYLWNNKSIMHLVQSKYAFEYVKENGAAGDKIRWLSDYINSEYLHVSKVPGTERQPMVLFNPRKGFDKTAEIIQCSRGLIQWVALTGFKPESLRELMQRAKVYIDFGNHPGRDRIPREAAMCGCLVITNRKGAAANDVDVLINDEYKFGDEALPTDIVDTIIKLISEYDDRADDYIPYNNRTAREFQTFEKDIYSIFKDLSGGEDTIEEAAVLKKRILECIYDNNVAEAYRTLIKYKSIGYEEDTELVILEAHIRIGLGEKYEAEYILREELKNCPDNYEILIMLAGIHSSLSTKEDLLLCVDECQQAMKLSEGTPDAGIVMHDARGYIATVKRTLASFSTD